MQTAIQPRLTAHEYLEIERKAPTKSEFLCGEVFAMAGGTEAHSVIAGNVIRELGNQLKGKPCRVYTSDMRLKVEATDLHAYPDVQVACGNLRFDDPHRDTLLNPKVIVEVLSESTEAWDRGDKFRHYRQLESLTDYVLVSQRTWLVEHYSRQADGSWLLQTSEGQTASLNLPSIGCAVPLTEIYANTDIASGRNLKTKS